MLTREEFQDKSDNLDEVTKQAWLLLFRDSQFYTNYAWAVPDLEARLEATRGTVKARMLNALLELLEELGPGESMLVPGTSRGGVQYSQRLEREALVNDAWGLLYDITAILNTTGSRDTVAVALRKNLPARFFDFE